MIVKLQTDRPTQGVYIRNLRKLSDDWSTNYNKYCSYFKDNPRHLDSSNILYKILTGTALGKDVTLSDFIASTTERADQLAGVLGICNQRSKGTYQDTNSFYAKPFKEVIVFNINTAAIDDILESMESIETTLNDIRLTRCIRVLTHTSTTMEICHLDGTAIPASEGYAVIEIDPVRLALAYRIWRLGESSSTAEGIELTMGNFLQQYIIPEMQSSHADIALWNRLLADSTGLVEPCTIKSNVPFFTLAPEPILPSVSRSFNNVMQHWTKGVSDLYGSVGLITGYRAGFYTEIKGLPVNAQTEWVHFLVQYNHIRFALFHVSLHDRDQYIESAIRRWISRVVTNRHLLSGHRTPVRLHLQSLLYRLMDEIV